MMTSCTVETLYSVMVQERILKSTAILHQDEQSWLVDDLSFGKQRALFVLTTASVLYGQTAFSTEVVSSKRGIDESGNSFNGTFLMSLIQSIEIR